MKLFVGCNKKILFALGIVCAISIGYLLVCYTPVLNHFGSKYYRETEVATRDSGIKLNANTSIVQKVVYQKCNDVDLIKIKPEQEFIGLNYYQLQSMYPGWTIEKFDVQEVVMTLYIDSFCREHANNIFLGLKDGYVAIFYGKPGTKAILKEITKIPAARLMQQDADELRRGIVINSREELMRTLEGLQSR